MEDPTSGSSSGGAGESTSSGSDVPEVVQEDRNEVSATQGIDEQEPAGSNAGGSGGSPSSGDGPTVTAPTGDSVEMGSGSSSSSSGSGSSTSSGSASSGGTSSGSSTGGTGNQQAGAGLEEYQPGTDPQVRDQAEQLEQEFIASTPGVEDESQVRVVWEDKEEGTIRTELTKSGERAYVEQQVAQETGLPEESFNLERNESGGFEVNLIESEEPAERNPSPGSAGVKDLGAKDAPAAPVSRPGAGRDTVNNPTGDAGDRVMTGAGDENTLPVSRPGAGRDDTNNPTGSAGDMVMAGRDEEEFRAPVSRPGAGEDETNTAPGSPGEQILTNTGDVPEGTARRPSPGQEETKERFGDIDWSAPLDRVEEETGVDVPYGGDPNQDEVENALDERSSAVAERIRERGDAWSEAVAPDTEVSEQAPGGTPVGFATPGRVNRAGSRILESSVDLVADVTRTPSAALEGAEVGDYLLEKTAVQGGSPEEFNQRAGKVAEAGEQVAEQAVQNAKENPRAATTDALVGLAVGGAISRSSRIASRSARTSPDAPDAPDVEDAPSSSRSLDLSGPAQRARNRASKARTRLSNTRERAPDVDVRLNSDSSVVEIDPYLKRQIREGVSRRLSVSRRVRDSDRLDARQLGRESRLKQARVRNAASDARTRAEVTARQGLNDLPEKVRDRAPDAPSVNVGLDIDSPTDKSARQLGRESRLKQERVKNAASDARTRAEVTARQGLNDLPTKESVRKRVPDAPSVNVGLDIDSPTDKSARQLGRESRLLQERVKNAVSDSRTGAELAARTRLADIGFSGRERMNARQLGRESRLKQERVKNVGRSAVDKVGETRNRAELALRKRLATDSDRLDARQLGRESRLKQERVKNVGRTAVDKLGETRNRAELTARVKLDDLGDRDLGSPTLRIGPIRPRRTDARYLDSPDERGGRSVLRGGDDDDDAGFTPVERDTDGDDGTKQIVKSDVRRNRRGDSDGQRTVVRMQRRFEPDRRPRSDALDDDSPDTTLRDAGYAGSLASAAVGELERGPSSAATSRLRDAQEPTLGSDPTGATGTPTPVSRVRDVQEASVDVGTDAGNVNVEATGPVEVTGPRSSDRDRTRVGVGVSLDSPIDTETTSVSDQDLAAEAGVGLGGTGKRRPRFGGADGNRDDDNAPFRSRDPFSSVLERDLINPLTGE